MPIIKEIRGNELYLYMNGELIYKRWLDTGQSKVFDITAYDKYTRLSYRELHGECSDGLISVKVKVTLRSSKEGGRTTGIASGYRPDHVFEYDGAGKMLRAYIGDIRFDGHDTIKPGESKEVIIRFLEHQPIEKFLHIGRKWWLHEGPIVIGQAEMISDNIVIQRLNK